MKSLNHIFRTIWSEALGAWIAVSEITKTKGKRSASSLIRAIRVARGNAEIEGSEFKIRLKPVCLAVALCFAFGAQANPIGGTVINGQASFNTSGNTLTVTNTPGTIINWQGFYINANEVTHFAQQSAASTVLNRVVTNDPSKILGTLSSNGRVYLINANGIMFGAGSTVDVAGLVATTLNLSNADFQIGRASCRERVYMPV
jgi:filamentous hemagglutinin family protein